MVMRFFVAVLLRMTSEKKVSGWTLVIATYSAFPLHPGIEISVPED